jgi:hypothetical protein
VDVRQNKTTTTKKPFLKANKSSLGNEHYNWSLLTSPRIPFQLHLVLVSPIMAFQKVSVEFRTSVANH